MLLQLGESYQNHNMRQLAELEKNLIFYAPLDEWSGTRDLVSGAIGTPTTIYPTIDNKGNGRRWLDYSNTIYSYTSFPSITFSATDAFSIILKINPSKLGWSFLVGSSVHNDGININYVGNVWSFRNQSLVYGYFSDVPIINTWVTIAYVADGKGNISLYIDGIFHQTITMGSGGTAITFNRINSGDATNNRFAGSISMLRIFNYALTPTQIVNYIKPEYAIEYADRIIGTIGTELITNSADRDFSSDTGFWSKLGNVTISGGICNINTSGAIAEIYKDAIWLINKKYRLTIQLLANRLGQLAIDGGISTIPILAIPGTYSYIITASSTLAIKRSGSATDADFSNLSLIQVGCVLDLNSEGMGTSTWVDKTNSLTATNSGCQYILPSSSNLGTTYFNGSTGKIVYNGMNGLVGDITIAVIINPISILTTGYIFSNTQCWINILTTMRLGFSRAGSTTIASINNSINLNTINIILITSKSDGVTNFYINGVLSGTANQAAGTPVDGGSTLNIAQQAGNGFYNGRMNKLAIWNTILSSDQIALINQTF